MTGSKLLLPLRIPELGPFLGKLVVGTGRAPGGVQTDAVRYRLVTRVIEAAGEARRLSAHEERGPAVAALGRAAWLAAWDEAVGTLATTLVARFNAQLEAEARAVRMPRRLRRRVALDQGEQRSVAARLGSSGAILIPALDAVERCGGAALAATALEREAVSAWQESLKTAARRLEAAWLALEGAVEAETARWTEVADRVARWRKPFWPVWVFGTVGLLLLAWLGLMFGGYLPTPEWLVRLWDQGVSRL
jgi:hypothetical protein